MIHRDLGTEALRALSADRRQSILAMGGIACGVAAIVTALAIGNGARREALAEVESIGLDNVVVRAATAQAAGAARPLAPQLTLADADAIRRGVADATVVAPLRVTRVTASAVDRVTTVTLVGTTPDWRGIVDLDVARGRWMRYADVRDRRRVAVLGAGAARRLFPTGDPVGRSLKIGSDWFLVVGVLAGRSDPSARPGALSRIDVQESAIVPLSDVNVRLGAADDIDHIEEIAVRARTADRVAPAAAAVDTVLRRRGASQLVQIVVPRELVAARLRARRAFDAVLVAVATVALFISGIGIMNVMLAGVHRRTVEIGVRRAVGASRGDIVGQFVAEAALVSAAGGAAGVPFGVVCTAVVAAAAHWPTMVSASALALALALAVGVGITFGVYPAQVAARWTPCEALRHES